MASIQIHKLKLLLVPIALAALLAGVAVGLDRDEGGDGKGFPPIERAPAAEAAKRPNIVFIYTDDQEARSFDSRYMPRTMRLLGDQGTVFSNFVLATPICCPSRAAAFTGAYPHNNGVYMNKEGWGNLRDKQNNIAAWMQRAGYRTAWFGKFLQGYQQAVDDPSNPAPGFDDWLVTLKPKFFGYKLYTRDEDGKQRTIKGGEGDRAYYTDKLTRKATKLIREQAARERPLFMLLNHLAPHRGKGGKGRCATSLAPAPRDFGRFADEPLPRPPSFNRVDEGARTAFPSEGELDAAAIVKERDRNRCRLESLIAVDRSVARIHRALEREGEIENTIFVFTSDNGMLMGQHGLTGKGIPYEEGLRVPLAIKVPERLLGGEAPGAVDELVANVDLAPTLLELAGARPCVRPGSCRTLDGRSLVPLLEGREGAWPADRAIPIEGGEHDTICDYRGLRLPGSVLLQRVKESGDGSCEPLGAPELYDLDADPFQLDNLVASDPEGSRARVAELEQRLAELGECAGIRGRDQRPDGTRPCE